MSVSSPAVKQASALTVRIQTPVPAAGSAFVAAIAYIDPGNFRQTPDGVCVMAAGYTVITEPFSSCL